FLTERFPLPHAVQRNSDLSSHERRPQQQNFAKLGSLPVSIVLFRETHNLEVPQIGVYLVSGVGAVGHNESAQQSKGRLDGAPLDFVERLQAARQRGPESVGDYFAELMRAGHPATQVLQWMEATRLPARKRIPDQILVRAMLWAADNEGRVSPK